MSIIFAIITFFLVFIWRLEDNSRKFQKNIPIVHWREWGIRAITLAPSILLLSLPFPLNIWKMLISSGLEAFTFLLLFDGFYNLKRKENWWYLGTIDDLKGDGWWDGLQRRIPLKTLKILKIGVPICLILVYIYKWCI